MDAVEALEQLGGIARAADIVALSSRRRLRTAVSNKAIIHVDRDRYALHRDDLGMRLALEHNAHLSHLSAAVHHGWKVRSTPGIPHLLLPTGRPAPTSKAKFWFHDARRDELDGWATGPLLTVLLCARDLPFDAALTVADSALREKAVAHDDLVVAALTADGWIVLRFTYDQVMFQPGYVLRCIEMALAQRRAAA